MTTTTIQKVRVPLAQAAPIAEEVLELLAPACERIRIAGSIRRQAPDVGDIELVAIPKTAPVLDLFGGERGQRDLLDERCQQLLLEGTLRHRLGGDGKRAYGEKNKRLLYHGAAGELPLDVFVVTPPAQWGPIFTIRTGSAGFAHRLVTPRYYGGGMPLGMRQQDGALWSGSEVIETPEEEDFFRALGLVWLPPERRTDTAPLTRVQGGVRR